MSSEMPLSCGRQRVGFLALLPTLLRRLGADAGDALMQAGLAPDSLDDPTKFVPFKSAAELLVASARLTDCQQFGFMLGEQIRPQMLGLAGELMCNAPTLGAALRDFNSMQYTNSTSSVSYLIVTGGQADRRCWASALSKETSRVLHTSTTRPPSRLSTSSAP